MTPVFADTAYYVAVLNKCDSLHVRAVEVGESVTSKIVTTEFVLVEVANYYHRPGQRDHVLRFDERLRADQQTEIIPASPVLYRAGLSLYSKRPDKEWSLTDCTSFTVMTELGTKDALTADLHFVQAGFRALLIDDSN